MKLYPLLAIAGVMLASCTTNNKTVKIYVTPSKAATTSNPTSSQPKTSGPIGKWSGSSYGENISVSFGSNGSAILTNSAGANAGSWSSQGSGSYSVNIAGQSGRMVLVGPSTASLTIGGSTIQLNR